MRPLFLCAFSGETLERLFLDIICRHSPFADILNGVFDWVKVINLCREKLH